MSRYGVRVSLIAGLVAGVMMFCVIAIGHAAEPDLPAGYTCADVRAKVAELGRIKALAAALERGATWKQIREARKCLR